MFTDCSCINSWSKKSDELRGKLVSINSRSEKQTKHRRDMGHALCETIYLTLSYSSCTLEKKMCTGKGHIYGCCRVSVTKWFFTYSCTYMLGTHSSPFSIVCLVAAAHSQLFASFHGKGTYPFQWQTNSNIQANKYLCHKSPMTHPWLHLTIGILEQQRARPLIRSWHSGWRTMLLFTY